MEIIKLVIFNVLFINTKANIKARHSNDNILITFIHMIYIYMPIFIYLYLYIYTSIFRSINFILNQQKIMEHLTKISSLNSNKEENLTWLIIFLKH